MIISPSPNKEGKKERLRLAKMNSCIFKYLKLVVLVQLKTYNSLGSIYIRCKNAQNNLSFKWWNYIHAISCQESILNNHVEMKIYKNKFMEKNNMTTIKLNTCANSNHPAT
jgi:hypothetical protein